ncbi:MAG: hypothetical protein B7C24_09260 [Bacteroidetes bacterium 4572_77]|nr:MAG: hypothetical protein B7C24_09260 [Bacteroidetes bacterium 4572_77]
MLNTLIISKTPIKLLLKFFLNSNSESYLGDLKDTFGAWINAIPLRLKKFAKAEKTSHNNISYLVFTAFKLETYIENYFEKECLLLWQEEK